MAFGPTISRGQAEAKALRGEGVARILITDRYRAYHWRPLKGRQLCWAHRLRDFERSAGRLGPAGRIGRWRRADGQVLFRWPPRYPKGELDALTYPRRMEGLRGRMRRPLEPGVGGWHAKTAGTCKKVPERAGRSSPRWGPS